MSLINDLLHDLEERRGGNQDRHEYFDGLSAAQGQPTRTMNRGVYMIVAVLVIALLIALVLFMPLETATNTVRADGESGTVTNIQPEKIVQKVSIERENESTKVSELKLDRGISLAVSNYLTMHELPSDDIGRGDRINISSINAVDTTEGARANIILSGNTEYDAYVLEAPPRLVVEIPAASREALEINMEESQFIQNVRSGLHEDYIKLVFDLKQAATLQEHQIELKNGGYELSVLVGNQTSEGGSTAVAQEEAGESESESGEAVFNRHMEKSPRQNDAASMADKLYREAVYQYKSGDIDSSIDSLAKVIQLDPLNGKARRLLASAYLKRERVDLAVSILDDSVRKLPDEIEIRRLYAQLLYELGRADKAIEILRVSNPPFNQYADYHALLAGILQDQGQHSEAASIYRELVSINADNSLWWMGLGISEEALGNNNSALQAYSEALNRGRLSNNLKQYVSQRIQRLKREQNT